MCVSIIFDIFSALLTIYHHFESNKVANVFVLRVKFNARDIT